MNEGQWLQARGQARSVLVVVEDMTKRPVSELPEEQKTQIIDSAVLAIVAYSVELRVEPAEVMSKLTEAFALANR